MPDVVNRGGCGLASDYHPKALIGIGGMRCVVCRAVGVFVGTFAGAGRDERTVPWAMARVADVAAAGGMRGADDAAERGTGVAVVRGTGVAVVRGAEYVDGVESATGLLQLELMAGYR
jgi:hypothetical protein